jgi:hypothetical protein
MTERDSQMLSLPSNLWQTIPFGADDTSGGIGTEGDLVFTTEDGVPINNLWAEAQAALAIWNQGRSKLVDILTFPVVNEVETVPQVGEARFEIATEMGEPEGERLKISYFQLGYDFEDYDRATRFTWKFLRDADAQQVRAVTNALFQADEITIFKNVMAAIFDNENRVADIRNRAYNVYSLYNGTDGVVPPSYRGTSFTSNHSHYMVSGNTEIDSGDLEDAYENIAEHGYTIEAGTQIVVLMNRAQLKKVRLWRQGEVSANTVVANYDFIPSRNQPSQFLDSPTGLLGSLPPDTWNGLRVYGSYGDMLLIEEPFMPNNYFLMFGTGGAGNLQNLVGFREHKNPFYRGLRILQGNDQNYPLVESYFARAFGTGIRQRAGAVVMQIKGAGSYEVPATFDRSNPNFLAVA